MSRIRIRSGYVSLYVDPLEIVRQNQVNCASVHRIVLHDCTIYCYMVSSQAPSDAMWHETRRDHTGGTRSLQESLDAIARGISVVSLPDSNGTSVLKDVKSRMERPGVRLKSLRLVDETVDVALGQILYGMVTTSEGMPHLQCVHLDGCRVAPGGMKVLARAMVKDGGAQ